MYQHRHRYSLAGKVMGNIYRLRKPDKNWAEDEKYRYVKASEGYVRNVCSRVGPSWRPTGPEENPPAGTCQLAERQILDWAAQHVIKDLGQNHAQHPEWNRRASLVYCIVRYNGDLMADLALISSGEASSTEIADRICSELIGRIRT